LKLSERQFEELDFVELLFWYDSLDREKVLRQREQMTAAAFTAYLSGAGAGKSWDVFLRGLGLAEKVKPLTKEAKKKIIQKSRSIADRIMRMDRKGKKK
jgi:hypothetical protein